MRAEAEAHGPIRYLINTEHHVDHIFGNYWFKGVPVVNHQGLYDNFMVPNAGARPVRLRARGDPRPTTPTAPPIIPDRDVYYQDPNKGTIVFTGDLTLRVGDHTFHCLWTPGHTPGPARGPRARGARRVHRRHDLLRVPDLADDLGRRPVGRRRSSGSASWTSTTSCPGTGRSVRSPYLDTQRAVLLEWKAAVADAVAKGWTREETIARVRFDDAFGPVDIGQGYMMDHIQTQQRRRRSGTSSPPRGTRPSDRSWFMTRTEALCAPAAGTWDTSSTTGRTRPASAIASTRLPSNSCPTPRIKSANRKGTDGPPVPAHLCRGRYRHVRRSGQPPRTPRYHACRPCRRT